MPIRINLLAEQQAAEEARRRDPVKRAIWAGCGFIALLFVWGGWLQVQVAQARSKIRSAEEHWKQIEPKFLQASNLVSEAGLIERRLDDLQHYATNRFLWTESLNALQHATDDQVRVVNLHGSVTLKEEKQVLVSSNLFLMRPKRKLWTFWTVEAPKTNMTEWGPRVLSSITNRSDLLRYQSHLLASLNIVTNPIQIVAQMEVVKPETITEKIMLTLRARDYSSPPGSRMDSFFASITNAPYFRAALSRNVGSLQPESIQPRDDRTDLIRPNDPFIPFTIGLTFPERIRSNE